MRLESGEERSESFGGFFEYCSELSFFPCTANFYSITVELVIFRPALMPESALLYFEFAMLRPQ